MRHDQQLVFAILNAARKRPSEGRTLEEVLKETMPTHWDHGKIPDDSTAAIIGLALQKLLVVRLIAMTDSSDARLDMMASSELSDDHDFRSGYHFAEKLRGREAYIVVKITPHFSQLQEVLKFSISDMLESHDAYSTKAKPIFGEPKDRLFSDIFVLMPFEQMMRPVYEDHIKSVCQQLGLSCQRADDFFGASQIMRDVWSAIFSCRCLVADCTSRNPNVFYEIGIAHTLGKPVILITQDEKDVPFDIRHIRFIKYSYTPRGMTSFESDLKSMIAAELAL